MFESIRFRRLCAGLTAWLLVANLGLVNMAHATEHRQVREGLEAAFESPSSPWAEAEDDGGFQLYPGAPMAATSSDFGAPRAPGDSEEEPRKGLWTRIKEFMAEDWRQTKEDMRKVGNWLTAPIRNFKYGWRRLREKVGGFRRKLFRGGKLFALSMMGRELQEEEEMVHLLLTAYIDQNGVEDLLEVLDNSDDSKLEQVAVLARKVEDPVLRSQLLQRYVAKEYLRMRDQLENEDPQVLRAALERVEEEAATLEITDPDPVKWQKPVEVSAAPVYQPYFPFVQSKKETGKRKISLQKVLIALIGGAGLILAGYFALTTMTIAPFLAFMSSVVSLFAVSQNMRFGQQILVVPQPMPGGGGRQPFQGGPYPPQPPTEEPPPLVTPPPIEPTNPLPGGGGDPTPDPNPRPDPDPVPRPDPLVLRNPVKPGRQPAAQEEFPTPKPRIQGKLSINRAQPEEFEELPGIGPTLARRIVEYRQQHPFRSLVELKKVQGLGPAKLRAMAPYVTL